VFIQLVAGVVAGINEIEPNNRLAEDKWYSRLTSAAKGYEHEMGLVCISVVGYTTKDGRLAIDM
jgi:hypothetical protein